MEDIFTVEKLNLYYGKNHALKDLGINLKKNKVTALIGPSGCGKSTFLRCLNRMNDLIENCSIIGTIKFGGRMKRLRGLLFAVLIAAFFSS